MMGHALGAAGAIEGGVFHPALCEQFLPAFNFVEPINLKPKSSVMIPERRVKLRP
jgi:3-oxoacyl-(acyl-carrier-protein) synthase